MISGNHDLTINSPWFCHEVIILPIFLEHVSSIEWENVVLHTNYIFIFKLIQRK